MFRKLQPLQESSFWKNTEKFIFISTRPAFDYQIRKTFHLFYSFGVMNTITVVPEKNYFLVFSYNPYLQDDVPIEIDPMETNTSKIFESKLKNLYNYNYKIVSYVESPPFLYQNKLFMDEICRIQNASIGLEVKLNNQDSDFVPQYVKLLTEKKVDLTLNTGVKTIYNYNPLPSVITYDEKAFCAMVPNPQRTSFFELILKPFDGWTWIALLLTVAVCAFVWKLFKFFYPNAGDSTWFFMFGVFANFLGQSLKFRGNQRTQVLLVQICIVMTFILGNNYQSILTTFMTESREGKRLTTIDELMKSDYFFKVDPTFHDKIKESQDFQQFEKNMEELPIYLPVADFSQSSKKNIVFIMRCNVAEMYFDNLGPTEGPVEHYYMLPEKFYKSLASFELADDSPHRSFLQHFSDLVFESGIRQYWKNFILRLKDNRGEIEQRFFTDEEYLLKLADLSGVFIVWSICLLVCVLVLLLEIFLHDFMLNLNWQKIKENLFCQISQNTKAKGKKQKMKVKFIQVKPASVV